jgi:hypothetical protein
MHKIYVLQIKDDATLDLFLDREEAVSAVMDRQVMALVAGGLAGVQYRVLEVPIHIQVADDDSLHIRLDRDDAGGDDWVHVTQKDVDEYRRTTEIPF